MEVLRRVLTLVVLPWVAVAAGVVLLLQVDMVRDQMSTGHLPVPCRGQGLQADRLHGVEEAGSAAVPEAPFPPARGRDLLGDVAVADAPMVDVGAEAVATIATTTEADLAATAGAAYADEENES